MQASCHASSSQHRNVGLLLSLFPSVNYLFRPVTQLDIIAWLRGMPYCSTATVVLGCLVSLFDVHNLDDTCVANPVKGDEGVSAYAVACALGVFNGSSQNLIGGVAVSCAGRALCQQWDQATSDQALPGWRLTTAGPRQGVCDEGQGDMMLTD